MHHCIMPIFDQKNYILSNQSTDKGGLHASLHKANKMTRYMCNTLCSETRGGPYASLHNANKTTRYVCNTLCSVYISIIPKFITGGHVGTMAAILEL